MAQPQAGWGAISFIGTGDCGPVHGPVDGFPIERYTELVRPTLQGVDLKFANCERQWHGERDLAAWQAAARDGEDLHRLWFRRRDDR